MVIVTTPQDEPDVFKSYNLYATTTPVDVDQFITVVELIEDFWRGIVVLPKNGKSHAV